ncbi:unnamed protein product [Mytilus edulis]|uniref:DDE Tnp4 domain-containing protein n=1 Tax=Mytilus edulis TaxID=6550 RepID=A0A8S3V617_MYTED|nr:unnamed protein product [Mytilus edulis]
MFVVGTVGNGVIGTVRCSVLVYHGVLGMESVGITPSGVISFVLEDWGGRVSDRELTSECGILDLLELGDSVMADKGFTISAFVAKRQCAFNNIPPFRGIKNQFSTAEVFQTQEIAQLCFHAERSIERVKNFHIVEGVLPLSIAPLSTKHVVG